MRRGRSTANRALDLVVELPDGAAIGRVPEPARAQMQRLCTRLDLHQGGVPKCIAITSSVTGEGVSFTSMALAAVLGHDLSRRTCLLQVSRPTGEDPLADSAGLQGLVTGAADIDAVILPTSIPHLFVIGSGSDPDPMWTTPVPRTTATEVIAELRHRFEHVILDLPAVSTSTSGMVFAGAADATLLVARQRMTRIDQVERSVSDLRHTRLGVVLNDDHLAMPGFLRRRLVDV